MGSVRFNESLGGALMGQRCLCGPRLFAIERPDVVREHRLSEFGLAHENRIFSHAGT